jgi:Fe-S cluster assembly protein SufD
VGLINNIKSYSETLNLSAEKKGLFNSFLENGFPTIKDEDWKYTSLKRIIAEDFSIEETGNDIDTSAISKHSLSFKNQLIFVDGKLISSPQIKGVTISGYASTKHFSNS